MRVQETLKYFKADQVTSVFHMCNRGESSGGSWINDIFMHFPGTY